MRELYLDCNGSTPVEPKLVQRLQGYLSDPKYWGNLGASHAREGRRALQGAKAYVAEWAGTTPEGILFCSGATEANNLAIQGLAEYGLRSGKKHIIVSAIEHVSVLRPCEALVAKHGFELSVVPPDVNGRMSASALLEKLRPDTLLLCCMQVNNETGVRQPIVELAGALGGAEVYFHVDGVQGAAHVDESQYPDTVTSHPRIDMLSISGHKNYGICGIGALVLKPRNRKASGTSHITMDRTWPPLEPLLLGGNQQGRGELGVGLRSGSVPLALALSLRDALELCEEQRTWRRERNQEFRQHLLELLAPLNPQPNGAAPYVLPHVLNVQLPGIDGESALLNLRSLLRAGRGAACSNRDSSSNRILAAMGLSPEQQNCSLRFSWWHGTPRLREEEHWCAEVQRKLLRLRRM